MKQEETGKEKASKKNKKTHSKPFVYPYDLRDEIPQVSGGELYALHTFVVDVQVAVTGWVMAQVSCPQFTCVHTAHVCSGGCTYYIQCTYLHHIMVYMHVHILNSVYCTYYLLTCTLVSACTDQGHTEEPYPN